jgi:23S rRNA pseudouridine2605 synthase
MRLNRFIAACGICARREADELIAAGHITVNGVVVKEMGHKILPGKDAVVYKGNRLQPQNFVYILLNKPKNMITTTDDPDGRSTVLDAIEAATRFRVYPVGRLDRNTTGLLLLTNDGALAEKLTHPSQGVRKVYLVRLNREFDEADMARLKKGIELEDGPIKVDGVNYIEGKPMNEVGIEIHSGRNRIVRRIFEALGYEVVALDRTLFGPLTKKRLPRGEWRLLTEKEVNFLKMV